MKLPQVQPELQVPILKMANGKFDFSYVFDWIIKNISGKYIENTLDTNIAITYT